MFLAIGGVVSAQEQEVNAASERAEVNTAREKESSSSEVEVVSTNAVPSASRNFSAQFLKDLVGDQASIWTSPRNLGISDASWIIPIGGVTSALIVTDADYSKPISTIQLRLPGTTTCRMQASQPWLGEPVQCGL